VPGREEILTLLNLNRNARHRLHRLLEKFQEFFLVEVTGNSNIELIFDLVSINFKSPAMYSSAPIRSVLLVDTDALIPREMLAQFFVAVKELLI